MADLQTCGGARQHEGVSTAASHGRRVFIADEPRDRRQTRQAAAIMETIFHLRYLPRGA